uniref:Uncharacterized protein n=2 Tax=Arsenophonus nasoniae TaxID=638 RepID=D2TWW0_9GAMM|nr:hypothetical protein ARN_05590 [Arsenophonus nasoniae]
MIYSIRILNIQNFKSLKCITVKILIQNNKKGENMARKHIAVTEETKMKIERVALEVSNKTNNIIKWSEVVHYLIENYLEEARKDMLNTISPENPKKQKKY